VHVAAARAINAGLVEIQHGYMIGSSGCHRLFGHVPQAAGEIALAKGSGTGAGQSGKSHGCCP